MALVVLMHVASVLRAPDLPDEAPAFTLGDLEGRPVALEDYRGRMVVLNFWATWCTPCKLEIPALKRLAERRGDLVVLGIATGGDRQHIAATAEDLEIGYPVLVADRATLEAYDVSTFPTTVVVGPDGRVLTAHTGLMLDPHLAWAARAR